MSNKTEMMDSIEDENNEFLKNYFRVNNPRNKLIRHNPLIRIQELPIELDPIGREAFLKNSRPPNNSQKPKM